MPLHRPRRLLPGIAAAIAIALSSTGCGASGSTLDPVARAADVTSHAGGAHIAVGIQVTGAGLGEPFTMSGQGFFNYNTEEGTLSLDATGVPAGAAPMLASGGLHIEEIFKSSTIYIGSPLLAGRLPAGARWLKLDLGRFAQAIGFNLQQLAGGQSNPAQFLHYLRATSGTPTRVGSELVRGVPTTHYRAAVDLGKVAGVLPSSNAGQLRAALAKLIAQTGTSTIPVDVWVDRQHLVRRIALALSLSTGTQRARLGMTIDLFEFGPTPSVAPPPQAEVFDATQTALAGLGAAGG
jgi:hypothetical protein